MNSTFRKQLRGGEKLIGTMLSLTSPAVAEVLAATGIDWLFIDAEHGTFGTGDIQSVLQAAGQQVPCIVRVEEAAELPIKKSLDAGAAGVIVPSVNSAEQAEEIVRYARFSPVGSRGVGVARANGYGKTFSEYLDTANDQIAVIVQVEHFQAVENIEKIVKVPGVDAVLVGPNDLSASLGKMGQFDDPQFIEAIDHVTETCLAAKIPLGIFGVSPAAVRPYIERGYTLIVVGVDTMLLASTTEHMLKELR